MKKAALNYEFDISKQSVSKLRELVSIYLKDEFQIENAWFCDYFLAHRDYDYDKVIDIVFFGDFLRKFLTGALWPFEKYRFWVLSLSVKNVLVDLIGVPENCIYVIPRNKIISANPSSQSLSLYEIKKFYYAGQLRSEKNISLLIWTTYYLQKYSKLNIELNLVGDFYLGEFTQSSNLLRQRYKDYITDLISTLDWNIKPILHGKISNFNWGSCSKQSCYLNLSTFIYEDFGLAQSEASSNGLPSIISSWGGFNDHLCGFHIKIPTNLIGTDNNSPYISQFRGSAIAKYLGLSSNSFSSKPLKENSIETPNFPDEITLEQLQLIRKNYVKRVGSSIYDIFTNLSLVLDSHKGTQFSQDYFKTFSNQTKIFTKIIILDDSKNISNELLNRTLAVSYDDDTELILLKNLRYKAYLDIFFSAKKIWIPTELKDEPSLQEIFCIAKETIEYF